MRILVVGGSRFVGRAVVEAAVTAGHQVTLLHRGRTPYTGAGPVVELLTDRDADLSLLGGHTFDATVDSCAYTPHQVTTLAQALGGHGGQYLYVSSVSAYAPASAPGVTESGPLLDPTPRETSELDWSRYGELKVACELEAARQHPVLTILRPTYVIGPHDYTWRFPWWVSRLARGGEVLCPGPHEAPMQYVDARDQAALVLGLLEGGVTGAFHAATPRPVPRPFGFGDMIDTIAAEVAPAGTTLRWVDPEPLLEAGLDGRTFPLWPGEDLDDYTLALDPSAAEAAGLSPRPLAETVRDVARWLPDAGEPPDGIGLTPDREAALLAAG